MVAGSFTVVDGFVPAFPTETFFWRQKYIKDHDHVSSNFVQ